MSKVGFVLDPHLSSSNPSGRSDDYPMACLSKLEQVRRYAKERGWGAIVVAGDMWNTSTVARWMETSVIAVLKSSSCPWYAVLGNHDLKQRRVDGVNETIMGSFFASGVIIDLTENEIEIDGGFIKGMHFYTEPSEKVPPARTSEDWLVCHQYLGRNSSDETLSFKEIKDAGYFGVVAGHEHSDSGVEEIEGLRVVRCGSLLRHENCDSNYRLPAVAELDLQTQQVVLLDIQAEEPEKVFLSKGQEVPDEEVFDLERLKKFALSMEGRGFLEDAGDFNLIAWMVEEKGLIEGSEVHLCIKEYFDKHGIK